MLNNYSCTTTQGRNNPHGRRPEKRLSSVRLLSSSVHATACAPCANVCLKRSQLWRKRQTRHPDPLAQVHLVRCDGKQMNRPLPLSGYRILPAAGMQRAKLTRLRFAAMNPSHRKILRNGGMHTPHSCTLAIVYDKLHDPCSTTQPAKLHHTAQALEHTTCKPAEPAIHTSQKQES